MTLGTLFCLPFTGILASEYGWEWVFYVQGGLSLIWYFLWLCFVYDSPKLHPRISRQERDFIYSSMGVTHSSYQSKIQLAEVIFKLEIYLLLLFFKSITCISSKTL